MLSEFNSSDAQGSAFEEAMKTAESWQGKLNELSNTWTDFMNGLVTSDTAKNVLDFFTALIKGVDKFRDTVGTIPAILTSIATVRAFKNVGRTNKTCPFSIQPQNICIEIVTRFKIRLSNCWDDYAKAL